MYCYRIKKYIGAYYAVLGRVDALVFTAGIGENSSSIRQRACAGLDGLGISVDDDKNVHHDGSPFEIQRDAAAVKVLVIPTNEEMEIAQQTAACIKPGKSS
jgi:acetate kinase